MIALGSLFLDVLKREHCNYITCNRRSYILLSSQPANYYWWHFSPVLLVINLMVSMPSYFILSAGIFRTRTIPISALSLPGQTQTGIRVRQIRFFFGTNLNAKRSHFPQSRTKTNKFNLINSLNFLRLEAKFETLTSSPVSNENEHERCTLVGILTSRRVRSGQTRPWCRRYGSRPSAQTSGWRTRPRIRRPSLIP